MSTTGSNVGNRLWSFCHTLRHDGVDYGDYIEQLTYLLFLKMADERGFELPTMKLDGKTLPCNWPTMITLAGTDLLDYYNELLRTLGRQSGILGQIYTQSTLKLTNPVSFKQLLNELDKTEWTELEVDVKAEAFEGLLEKAASEGKKGAGQYFTPRVLIQSMVRCVKPDPQKVKEFKICDPASGTGGFLVEAYNWLMDETNQGATIDRKDVPRIRKQTYYGTELVSRPRRLALMNLYLHGLEGNIRLGDAIYEPEPGERFDVILANPPFGTKGAKQVPARDDFITETTSKQLNFLQHIITIMKPGGRAAVILPDNVLFSSHGQELFKHRLKDINLHTLLRLPRGTFVPYANARANVLFFTKGEPTEAMWVFDARTNVPSVTKMSRKLSKKHFHEFEECYGENPFGRSPREERERFKRYDITELAARNFKLDLRWMTETLEVEFDEETEPADVTQEITATLQEALNAFNEVLAALGNEEAVEESELVGV